MKNNNKLTTHQHQMNLPKNVLERQSFVHFEFLHLCKSTKHTFWSIKKTIYFNLKKINFCTFPDNPHRSTAIR